MLHTETVTPTTLDLIFELQRDPFFNDFYLVGGTALSLQIGHRISMDIDFFTRESFNRAILLEHLEKNYGFSLHYSAENTLKGFIDKVFVDLLKHDYPYVNEPVIIDGIRMLSKPDICAFKVNAITGNGTRSKDFVDIYFLLKEFIFADIIGFYCNKYGQRNDYHAVKSLIYFDDIDPDSWPNLVIEKELTMKKIKTSLIRHSSQFLSSGGVIPRRS